MIAAALMLSLATVAQDRPAPMVAPVRDEAAERIMARLSADGRAVIEAEMIADRARREAFATRLAAARTAIGEAARAQPLDLARLRAALEARDALEAERLRERTRTAVALLERLPVADRGVVVAIIPEASGPPAPPPPPPGGLPLPPPPRR